MKDHPLYPASEGWIRLDAQLNTSKPLGEAELKNLITFGKPEEYEIGGLTQNGKRVRAFSRHFTRKPKTAVTDAPLQPA